MPNIKYVTLITDKQLEILCDTLENDCASLILLHPESRKLVAINTHLGQFEYTRIPYGIHVSPATQVFQDVMDEVLEGIDCGCFLADIIVTGKK